MKKYLLYTILLVAFFIGISATASYAAETGDLTVNIGLKENYGINPDVQTLVFDIKLSNNGEPVTGTFPIEITNAKRYPNKNTVEFKADHTYINLWLKDSSTNKVLYYPNEASFIIKNIPVGTTYEIIPLNTTSPIEVPSQVEYYTTDSETGNIADGDNIIHYVLKPKATKFEVSYNDLTPDYEVGDISCDIVLHQYSLIPDVIHYYNSSNPDEKLEMERKEYATGSVDFVLESVVLKRGESIIVDETPLGTQFFVTPRSGSVFYMQTTSGQLRGTNGLKYLYTYHNPGRYRMITISKKVEGIGADITKEFTFKITASGLQSDSTYKPFNSTYIYNVIDEESGEIVETRETKFEDGIAYVKCKANQRIEIGNVTDIKKVPFELVKPGDTYEADFANKFLKDTHYKVEEVDSNEYEIVSENSEGISLDENVTSVVFTNTRKFIGNLTIKKEITEDVPEDEEFTFKIKLTDGATNLPTEYEYTGSKEGTLQFEDGIATITLKGGESITISGLPLKCTYEVQEEGDNYKITKENATGKVEEETIVTVTNSKKDEPQEETEDPDDPKEPVKQDDTEGEEKQEEQGKQEEQENVKDNVQEEKNEENIEEVKEENKEEQTISENPKTFDNINIIALITLCSLLAFICITKIKKSK